MVFGRFTALWIGAACVCTAQSPFYLKDHDRVVFYGDSITDQRLYTTFVETYAVTRFPNETFTFTHSGWGGDRVTGGGGGDIDLRLKRDVFAYKPTVVTIMLGMNDAGYRAFDQQLFDTYSGGYRHILQSIESAAPGARITVIQPSPYDDVNQAPLFAGGYNGVLKRYAEFVRSLANGERVSTADLNTPVVEALEKAHAKDAPLAKKLIPDRVHPGPGGHLLMAEALLKAWNAPALVSDVEIDAGSKSIKHARNAQVTGWNGARWTQTEAVLPMFIDWSDATTALAVNSSDFLDALDRETLTVTGLAPGRWALKIDGERVADFSSEELAAGVNLARYSTPMMKQAQQVHAYTKKHTDMHNTRWRNIQVPLAGDDLPGKDETMRLMDRMDERLIELQRQAAHPKSHQFELTAAS